MSEIMTPPHGNAVSAAPEPVSGYVRALDGAPLYCVFHPAAPIEKPQRRYHPVVLLPSLFEERKSAYAALRRLAERLAEAGHAALRFDYRGSGESGGSPAARRWRHLAEDAAMARKTLARLTGARDSILCGIRLGATLALQETLRAGGEGVLALAPVVKGAAQVRLWKMRSKIRSEITQAGEGSAATKSPANSSSAAGAPPAPGVLDFDGFEVAREFFDDVAAIDLCKDLAPLSCPGLLMQLSHREQLTPETQQLQDVLGARVKSAALRIEPFWDKIDDVDTRPVEDAALEWLARI